MTDLAIHQCSGCMVCEKHIENIHNRIESLKSENQRLREALEKIYRVHNTEIIIEGKPIVMFRIAEEALSPAKKGE